LPQYYSNYGNYLKSGRDQNIASKKSYFLDVVDASKIFGIEKIKTLYVLLQKLEKDGLINRVAKGKYHFSLKEYNEFELANFLVSPSYVLLESALSFYGILPQFPYTVTSVTPLKTKSLNYQEKECEYSHLKGNYLYLYGVWLTTKLSCGYGVQRNSSQVQALVISPLQITSH